MYNSQWKFYDDISFVANGSIDPDTPKSKLDLSLGESSSSPGSSLDGGENPPVAVSLHQPTRRAKRRLEVDESNTKRNAMYDAAIHFMQQPPPPPPKPKDEEERFGARICGWPA